MGYEHEGHRRRMYQKLGTGELLDTEILEMMLYPLIPRRNTVDLVHNLLKTFGSAVAVFYAPLEELKKVEGIGEKIASELYLQGILYRKEFKVVYDPFMGVFSLKEFILRAADMYKTEKNEVLDIYLISQNHKVLSRHRRTDEEEGRVFLDTHWLGKLLSDDSVYGVVMVHNHPKGRADHSKNDEFATRACQMVCNMHGKVLCDHVIFSNEGAYSYYQEGKLQKISEKYSVNTIIEERSHEEKIKDSADFRERVTQLMHAEREGKR